MTKVETEKLASFSERATILVMLVAIFLSTLLGIESWFSGKIEHRKTTILDFQKQVLKKIAAKTEPEIFLSRKILPLLKTQLEHPERLKQTRDFFFLKYGIDLNFYTFDKKARLKQSAPKRAPNIWLMKNLFPALIEKDGKKIKALGKKLDRKIQFSFGFGKDLISLKKNEERLIETSFDQKTGFFTWTNRKNGGLIIYCPEIPKAKAIFRQTLLGSKKPEGLISAGHLNPDHHKQSFGLPERAFSQIAKTGEESIRFAGYDWAFTKTASGNILFTCFKIGKNNYLHALHITRLICLIMGICSLCYFGFSSKPLQLKTLLITMFFASSMIPLSGIAITTIDNLDVYREIQTNKIRAGQEEALGNIAQNFSAYLASSSLTLMKLTESPGISGNSKEAISMKRRILSIFPDAQITVRNAGAQLLYSHGLPGSPGRETVFKSLSRRMIERYAPTRLNEHKYSGNPFSDSMANKDDMGFSTLINHPNSLQLVRTGNAESLLFYRTLPASAGDCAMVQVELSTFATMKKYFKSLEKKHFEVGTLRIDISAFFQKGYRWSLPPLRKREQRILSLAEQTVAVGKSQFERYSDSDSLNGFCLCMQVPELSGNCLIAYCSANQMDQQLNKMKKRIGLGALLALVIIFFIVSWISKQLISPLEHLSKGVQALFERKFESRLPEPGGSDEMAKLFSAFNEMMAESYDMQIAHNVQEGLIPHKFPEIENYSMHGMLRSASDLGGDCLDCFMMNETKLLFLIGDITGHGVGSALIMAFSRAITFHWSQKGSGLPTELTDQIDEMLRKNKTDRMFMGIICGTLDLETNEVEIVVKGHIYPLLIKKDSRKEWVGIPAFPLGIGRPSPSKSTRFILEEGDRLLCVTDGFLEGLNSNMEMIGFDRIENWADEAFSVDSKTWIANLDELYHKWCGNFQADDISIFALSHLNRENTSEQQ